MQGKGGFAQALLAQHAAAAARRQLFARQHAPSRAVWPSLLRSSALWLAEGPACTLCALLSAASIKAVTPLAECRSGLAECCSRMSTMDG